MFHSTFHSIPRSAFYMQLGEPGNEPKRRELPVKILGESSGGDDLATEDTILSHSDIDRMHCAWQNTR